MASETKAIDGSISKKKKVETWSQSTRIGEMTKEVRVEKLFNGGFLVIYSKHGEDTKGKWINKEIKTYSENNPLDEDGETEVEALSSVFSEISRIK